MQDLQGKVAVVTGAGGGIGEGLVGAFVEQGMHVVVSDIEEKAAQRVAAAAERTGVRALAVKTDVRDREAVEALADAAYDAFGAVHVLCNNAGVLLMGPMQDMNADDWRWVFDVNVFGVVHGMYAFQERMVEQGEGHIVNTASVAALGGGGVYGASKAAVLALSETLREELEPAGLGVSVLCPGHVNSNILGAQRNRPAEYGRHAEEPFGSGPIRGGLEPIDVGRTTIDAIRANRLYVFTYHSMLAARMRPRAEERFEAILAAIEEGHVG
jgi:NAD(P)-dependent dehydrogenase (short-subunit alcohol dehydrogenase family)